MDARNISLEHKQAFANIVQRAVQEYLFGDDLVRSGQIGKLLRSVIQYGMTKDNMRHFIYDTIQVQQYMLRNRYKVLAKDLKGHIKHGATHWQQQFIAYHYYAVYDLEENAFYLAEYSDDYDELAHLGYVPARDLPIQMQQPELYQFLLVKVLPFPYWIDMQSLDDYPISYYDTVIDLRRISVDSGSETESLQEYDATDKRSYWPTIVLSACLVTSIALLLSRKQK